MKHTRYLRLAALCGLVVGASALQAQVVGQWDFDTGNLNATAGNALTYRDGDTQIGTKFGSTTTLGLPSINGAVAKVMGVPTDVTGVGGYTFDVPSTPNGGSASTVNDYTLILDVLYPATSQGKVRAILNANFAIDPNADLFIGANNGIGANTFSGLLLDNTWHRIAFVVGNGSIEKYIDGAFVGEETGVQIDGRWALIAGGTADLFSDDNGQSQPGFVNSIQLRTEALNPGQVLALGGPSAAGIPQTIPPVPAYFSARSPNVNATGVGPLPAISATLKSGDSTIVGGSVGLRFDGASVPATVTIGIVDGYFINYQITNLLAPSSTHLVSVVWTDAATGPKTNSWSFTVGSYQSVTLPAPLYLETFDEVAEGAMPTGWVATNATTAQTAGLNLDDPTSDTYNDFVVINSNRLATVFGNSRIVHNPIVLNGRLIDNLVHGNLLYADSDNRANSPSAQVNVVVTSDYNLSGKTNIFVAFNSGYEQNQDNIDGLEYSIDQGATWLPIIYFIDDQNMTADVIRTNGVIDVGATLNTARPDQAFGTNYGFFAAAPIGSIKPSNISGRINDDELESKRIEVYRVTAADGQSKVRFRFFQAGTSSWFWTVDDFGLYSINTPVLTTQPMTQTIDADKPVTFTVAATINPPYTYQWQFNNADLSGATNQSFSIASVQPINGGAYNVLVKNSDGTTKSAAASLIVVDAPIIAAQPQNLVTSVGNPLSLPVSARGRAPLSYNWLKSGTSVQSGSTAALTLASPTAANSGSYQVVVSNASGSVTSSVVSLEIFTGTISDGLVTHIKFDGSASAAYNDASGRGNNATAVGAPVIVAGKIGSGAMQFTTAQDGSSFNYATLGTPEDLLFGSTNDFTVSMWLKVPPNSFKGDPAFFGSKNWGSGDNQGVVFFCTGPLRWNYREGTTGTRVDYNPGGNYADGIWHHLLVSFDRGVGAKTYIDGQLLATTAIGTDVISIDPPSGLMWNLGQDGTGSYTDGGGVGITNAVMDDVGIWRRVVTPQEVASIYAQGQAGMDLTTATTVTIGSITIVPAGTSVTLNWTAAAGVKLQSSTSLTAPVVWADVAGTTGVGTITQPASGTATFYRLTK
jgi:hypothetical protein